MRKIIENIRQKPEHHRDRIIWICVGVAAGLLLLVWAIIGNGRKVNTDDNVFRTFNEDVNEGKDIVPQEINLNTNQ